MQNICSPMLFRHTSFSKNQLTSLLNVAIQPLLMIFIAIEIQITAFFTIKRYIFTTKRQLSISDSFEYELMQRPYLPGADIRSLLFIIFTGKQLQVTFPFYLFLSGCVHRPCFRDTFCAQLTVQFFVVICCKFGDIYGNNTSAGCGQQD